MNCYLIYIFVYIIVILNYSVITYQRSYIYHRKYINLNNHYLHKYYHKQQFELQLSKTKKGPTIIIPEFSRIINIQQIPKLKPVLCRLLANNEERQKLSMRLDIPVLLYFASNVTLSRKDERSILVNGQFEAHLKSGK